MGFRAFFRTSIVLYGGAIAMAVAGPFSDLGSLTKDFAQPGKSLDQASQLLSSAIDGKIELAKPPADSRSDLYIYGRKSTKAASEAKPENLPKWRALFPTKINPVLVRLYDDQEFSKKLMNSIPDCKDKKPEEFQKGFRRGLAGMAFETRSLIPVCQTRCCFLAERLGLAAVTQAHPQACKPDQNWAASFLKSQCEKNKEVSACIPDRAGPLSMSQISIRACFEAAMLAMLDGGLDCSLFSEPKSSSIAGRGEKDLPAQETGGKKVGGSAEEGL